MRHRPLLQVRKLFRRGRCPHRPAESEPAPTAACTRRAFSVQPDNLPRFVRPAVTARMRSQSAVLPAPDARNRPRKASPVMGSGVGDWSAGAPRRQTPAILWFLSDRSERNIPKLFSSTQNEEKPSFSPSSFARFSFLKRSNASTERHTLFLLPFLQNRTKGNEASHKVLLPASLF